MKLLALGAIVVVCLAALIGQELRPSVRTDLTCVENMAIPQYDGGAWVARFSGTARVSISVGADGTPVGVEVQTPSQQPPAKQLAGWLRESFKDAKFSTRCAGQAIEINFTYELRGEPTPTPHNKTRLKNANTFEVVANPPIPIIPQP